MQIQTFNTDKWSHDHAHVQIFKHMHSLGILCLAQTGRVGMSRLPILIQKGGTELSNIHKQCNESVGMGFTYKLKHKCALSEFLNTSSCPWLLVSNSKSWHRPTILGKDLLSLFSRHLSRARCQRVSSVLWLQTFYFSFHARVVSTTHCINR